MKKVLIGLLAIIILFVATIFLFPAFYKGKVISFIDGQLAEMVDARISFDHEAVALSIIRDFPNISLGLKDLAIVGNGQFEQDTLLAASRFYLSIDIKSVFSDEIALKKIHLVDPLITIVFAKDGAANYDIYISSEEEENKAETEEVAEEIAIALEHWEIENGRIYYKDYLYNMFMSMEKVNHKGSGDFALDIFDMNTHSDIGSFSFDYDGVSMMSKKHIEGNIILGMDIANYIFTFKENELRINDFAFSFDGFFAMPEEGYDMDISFKTKQNTFKSFLSLIPGMYAEGFDNLETKGSLAFSGFVKGMYTDNKMPGWDVSLQVKDGFVKSPDLPLPIDKIQLNIHTSSSTGEMKDGTFDIRQLSLLVDKETFTATLGVKNFDNPLWDVTVNGALNLDLISRIMPTEDFSLKGRIVAALESRGTMSDLEAEQYQKLHAAGTMSLKDFAYNDTATGTFSIHDASMSFNPQTINLGSFNASWGNSNFSLKGAVNNYMAYVLKDDLLKGQLSLSSNMLDLNEIMAMSGEEVSDQEADTTAMAVVAIPKNIDFVFNAAIAKLAYDTYTIDNMRGMLLVKDGILSMKNLNFNMLGGDFTINGTYDTEDKDAPLFNFDMAIKRLDIKKAYENFVTIQRLAPIAEHITGTFSTDFKIGGLLEENMMPDFSTLTGKGLIAIASAAVTNSHLISGVNNLSKLGDAGSNEVRLKDLRLNAEIENGRLYVEPFVAQFGKYATTIGGSTGIDGSLDYILAMNVPSGAAGQAFNSAVSSFTGSSFTGAENVVLNFNMGGFYNKPDIKLGKVETAGGSAKTAVKQAVSAKIAEEKAEIKAEMDKHREEAEAKAKAEAERIRKEAEAKAEAEKEELKNKAKKKLKNIIGG